MRFFLVVFILLSYQINSQNLIKNGGFELIDFWKCVTGISNPTNSSDIYGKPSFVFYHTFTASDTLGSPYLLSTLANNNSAICKNKCGAPNTQYGYKAPRSGNNFVFANTIGSHELTQPLVKNQLYVFECYLSTPSVLKTVKPFSINYFHDTTQGYINVQFLKNTTDQATFTNLYNDLLIRNIQAIDTSGWTKISTCFAVQDTVKAIAMIHNIGAFIDDIAIYPASNFNTITNQKPCESEVQFNITNTTSNFSYYYSFGDGNFLSSYSNSLAYDYHKSGTYHSNIISKDTITNQYFCSTNTLNIVSIKADFSLPSNMVTELNYTAINNSIDATNYVWLLNNTVLPSNTFSSNENSNELCLIANNNTNGCSDTVCKSFVLDKCGKITSANIFTPNFDGNNDVFYFFETEPCDTNNLKINIYDRWGKVYYQYPNPQLYSIQPTTLTESKNALHS